MIFLLLLCYSHLITCDFSFVDPDFEQDCNFQYVNMSATKIPAFAISHGAPNMILNKQDKTTMFLASLGKQIVKAYNPKAILVVSAHWETSQFEVTNRYLLTNPFSLNNS